MRTLEELIDKKEPAWPLVKEWIKSAENVVEILPGEEKVKGATLRAVQVTTRSPMGAIVYETGGILVDRGWIRILGSGSEKLPRSLSDWNDGKLADSPGSPPPILLVADDVLGGFFAINGGGLGPDRGGMYYFAPDTLEWEPMEMGYSGFLQWAFSGNLEGYYEGLRWEGWENEVSQMRHDQAFSIFPMLGIQGPEIGQRSRKLVPVEEIWSLLIGSSPK